MRKEPTRRYVSVAQFSEDIRRHLEGLPVIAHKDTLPYRTAKFVKRNKVAAAAAALIVLTLVGGIVATLRQKSRAERRFNDVRQLANDSLFKLDDAIKDLPGATAARALLVRSALEDLDKLQQESGDDAALQREVAAAYPEGRQCAGKPDQREPG